MYIFRMNVNTLVVNETKITWWRHDDVKQKVHFGIKQISRQIFGQSNDQDGNDNPDFTRFRKEFSWSILIFGSKSVSKIISMIFKEQEKILFDQKRTLKPQIRDNFSKHGQISQKSANFKI